MWLFLTEKPRGVGGFGYIVGEMLYLSLLRRLRLPALANELAAK